MYQSTRPNNISPIIRYSQKNGAKVLWMRDLETDFMEDIEDDISFEKIDILFAPHHGRNSGKVPKSWLDKLNPKIIVIGEAPSTNINYYHGFDTIKQNSAGDLLFECVEKNVGLSVGKNVGLSVRIKYIIPQKKSLQMKILNCKFLRDLQVIRGYS